MTEAQGGEVPAFSLLGGPLHGLGRRLGLVRGPANSVPLGLALGVGAWAVLVALALIGGLGAGVFSLSLIAGHIRLLLVIPLFFLCEAWVDPRMTAFVQTIVRSGVVPSGAIPSLTKEILRARRWKDSWVPDVLCLAGAVGWSVMGAQLDVPGLAAEFRPSHAWGSIPLADRWYWVICLPLFRFLLLRWIWRLALWIGFLGRLASFDLWLVPTHPDGAGGLGYLEVVQTHFLPLIFAISAVQAASLAEELASGMIVFEAIYPVIALALLADVILFLGPAAIFTPRLWASRVRGLASYMEFAAGYVRRFDQKWIAADATPGEPVLGTPDLQSLADLSNSINIVRNMRILPIGLVQLGYFAIVAMAPMLPLLVLKYPIAELAQKFFTRLVGL